MFRKGAMMTLVACVFAGCADVEAHGGDDENELISTVTLRFVDSGGVESTFTWSDPENDGDPVIETIALDAGEQYTLFVGFVNDLASPPEAITEEVRDEGDEHQVFFTGPGVAGPATGSPSTALISQSYADEDLNGLPVGLENAVEALVGGVSELTVTLRHMPPEGNAIVKVDGAAETVATEGFSALGGDNDAQVSFPLTVNQGS